MIEMRGVCGTLEAGRRSPVASLDGVSLRIERGEWVWLVGPSGAGKSSVLRLLCATARAARGEVLLEGRDVATLGARATATLRRGIGVVPSDLALLPDRTAWEQVALPLRVREVSSRGIARWVPDALERAGVGACATLRPSQLTPPQRVRVALARALVNGPTLLLIDDPTAELEPAGALEWGALAHELWREHGTTTVFATRERTLVDGFSHRVIRLREGRIASDQNPGTFGSDDPFAEVNRAWTAARVAKRTVR